MASEQLFVFALLACVFVMQLDGAPQGDMKKIQDDFNKAMTDKAMSANNACKTKTGVNVENMVKGTFDPKTLSQPEKCYITCVMSEFGVISSNKFTPDAIEKIVPKEIMALPGNDDLEKKIETVFKKCQTTVNEKTPKDDCEIGGMIVECLMTEAKEAGIQLPV